MKQRTRNGWVAFGVATLFAIFSGLPQTAVPASAASLGFQEPTAQQIQQEIAFVQAQGVSISVVGHVVRPTMDLVVNGEHVIASNVPAVEFEIGTIPSGLTPTGLASTPASIGSHLRVDSWHTPLSARTGHAVADYARSFDWQDSANGNGGGYPHFYFSAHYNLSCPTGGGACTAETFQINHEATTANTGDSTLTELDEAQSCGGNGFPGFNTGNTGTWGQETSDGNWNHSCTQYQSNMWAAGGWIRNATAYGSCYNNTANCPGDHVTY